MLVDGGIRIQSRERACPGRCCRARTRGQRHDAAGCSIPQLPARRTRLVPGCATTVHKALNVFSRRDGQIRHAYCTELLLTAADPEHVAGYVDSIWPP
jgi:hypothetical protein